MKKADLLDLESPDKEVALTAFLKGLLEDYDKQIKGLEAKKQYYISILESFPGNKLPTTEDVLNVVKEKQADSAGLTLEEIEKMLREEGFNFFRSRIAGIVGSQLKKGTLRKDAEGRYSYSGN